MKVKVIPPKRQKVHITPPQGGNSSVDQLRMGEQPMLAYGGPISKNKSDLFSFDNRWNPTSYQGQIGVNPDPNPYARTGNILPETEQDGGNVINAEKQEQVLGNFTPDGLPSLMNVDGPPHTEGGKNVEVPSNAFVFSDTPSLKIKDPEVLKLFNQTKSKTPAQIAKNYQLQKYTKVLADPDSDPVSKKTAELMVQNYSEKLNLLAEAQENLKQHKGLGDNQQSQIQQPMAQLGGGDFPKGFIPYSRPVTRAQGYPDDAPQTTADYQQWANDRGAGLSVDDKMGYNTANWENTRNSGPEWGMDKGMFTSPNTPYEIPNVPNPTNIGPGPSDPDTRIGSYDTTMDISGPQSKPGDKPITPGYTKVPFTSPTPDKLGLLNSLINSATIHRYPAWEAPVSAVAPNTVFEDPTRAIAAQQEAANANSYSNALSANSKAARAQGSLNQGIAGAEAANIIGQTNNRNVDIANRASQQTAEISNRLQAQQAERLNKLYQGNVISKQQYDNALRESRNDITNQLQQSWKDRRDYAMINKTSPFFYSDPITGEQKFKSKEAESNFWNVVNKDNVNSSPEAEEGAAKEYKRLLGLYGKDEDGSLLRAARRKYGLEKHATENIDPLTGRVIKERVSGVPYQELGGSIPKRQFGGFTNHQLKKFIADSWSK